MSAGPRARGLAKAAAFVLGLGFVPKAAGTCASILGLALTVGAHGSGGTWAVAALGFALLGLGVWACEAMLKASADGTQAVERHRLVIRELAGQVLTLAVAPMTPAGLLIGFGAFQMFTLARPWPDLGSSPRLPRGVGVMLDGVLAAIGAAATVGFMTWTLGTA